MSLLVTSRAQEGCTAPWPRAFLLDGQRGPGGGGELPTAAQCHAGQSCAPSVPHAKQGVGHVLPRPVVTVDQLQSAKRSARSPAECRQVVSSIILLTYVMSLVLVISYPL